MTGIRRLDLSGRGLTELPAEVFELADTLEILDLSGNALAALPDDLPRLHKLRIVFASGNRFTDLPEVLGRCENLEMLGFKANQIRRVSGHALPARLRWLILTDNRIETLPAEIGHCQRLQKLALAGNHLQELPLEMASCTQLELLRISANQLTGLPDWLLALPRLSWLAFGGNPFNAAREDAVLTHTPLPAVPWAGLQIQHRLGEGASGVIHRTQQQGDDAAMALKIFKGEVTSDGLPSSEMAAAMHAGAHPSLIPVLGRLTGHPALAQGLAMQLIAPAFSCLAGPPSFDSCTRDVYAPETRFDLACVRQLAGGIASAAQQLHARGINHGDLYGHNILRDRHGRAYLGDFGAASFFDPGSAQAEALQRVEVRAFGCLLEELIERCDGAPTLQPLRDACLSDDPASRPLFGEIEHALQEPLT
jgi:hypothetical protein